MKSSNRISVLLACTTVAALVLGACQPQIVEKEVVVTQIVEKTVEKEVIVEKEKIVEVTTEDYTTPHPILSDVKVRQAIAHCTNRPEVIASVYGWLDDKAAILMDTQIPTSHWAYTKPKVQYAFDVAKGGALLDEAGWKLGTGADYRSDADGNELALRFTTTRTQFRRTWAAVFEANMKACGIRVVRLHAPASWWFGDTTGLARRDYELGAFAWVGDADPGGQSLYACDKIPLPSNGWEGQNGMGWCNEAASNAIKGANNTLDRAERVKQYAIFQEVFAADMPSLPMFNRVEVNATAADLAGFDPRPGQPYPTYNVADWERPGETTMILGLSQEPASLFTLVESAWVASLASTLIHGVGITSLDYDFAANMYFKELPTLENKGATLVAVDVKDGDKV
ncbi:MAG: ABC transporter substrate-binding protein, partial [Chloroflexi bacterium]|nr:ABC transporter substrate-binding protein [Chloroflexota bacterium]